MEITMNSQSSVIELVFQTDPVHVFEFDGKAAFIAQQIGDILDIKDASKSVRQSKALEKSTDYDIIPTTSQYLTDKLSATYGEQAPLITILYLSGFFLFVLRSNKDIAVPFTRWAIREAIPQAFQKRQVPELSASTLIELVKEERRGSRTASYLLGLHGWSDPNAPKQLTIDGGQP